MSTGDEALRPGAGVVIPLSELGFEFSRASGPGGQNVNKVNTRVTLRFDLATGGQMSEPVRRRLLEKLQSRLTRDGEILIHASEYRLQGRNKEAAIERLRGLLVEALLVRKKRRQTRPSRGAVERRIQASKRRGALKKTRRKPNRDD
jgi:ribosome-associated protein